MILKDSSLVKCNYWFWKRPKYQHQQSGQAKFMWSQGSRFDPRTGKLLLSPRFTRSGPLTIPGIGSLISLESVWADLSSNLSKFVGDTSVWQRISSQISSTLWDSHYGCSRTRKRWTVKAVVSILRLYYIFHIWFDSPVRKVSSFCCEMVRFSFCVSTRFLIQIEGSV